MSKIETEYVATLDRLFKQRRTNLLCLIFGSVAFACAVYRAGIFTRHSPLSITGHDLFFIVVLAIFALFVGHGRRRLVFPRPPASEPSVSLVVGLTFAYFVLGGAALYLFSEFGL
ncbi:MAG: hypothetical protein V4710_00400, partial [Verrucomicrobiota bacterium]